MLGAIQSHMKQCNAEPEHSVCRVHYIIAYSAVLGFLLLVWVVTALRRWSTERVVVPSKLSPAGTDASYKDTELAEAHRGEQPRERTRPAWVPETPPQSEQ